MEIQKQAKFSLKLDLKKEKKRNIFRNQSLECAHSCCPGLEFDTPELKQQQNDNYYKTED